MSSSLIDRTITGGCGGIGRHAALRGQCLKGRMSSSLINRTNNEISASTIRRGFKLFATKNLLPIRREIFSRYENFISELANNFYKAKFILDFANVYALNVIVHFLRELANLAVANNVISFLVAQNSNRRNNCRRTASENFF